MPIIQFKPNSSTSSFLYFLVLHTSASLVIHFLFLYLLSIFLCFPLFSLFSPFLSETLPFPLFPESFSSMCKHSQLSLIFKEKIKTSNFLGSACCFNYHPVSSLQKYFKTISSSLLYFSTLSNLASTLNPKW